MLSCTLFSWSKFDLSPSLFLWYCTLSFGSGKINQNLSDLFRLPLGPCFSRGGCISGCSDRLSVFKLIVNHSLVCCACLCSCCQSDSQSVRSSIPDSCVVVLVSSVSSGQLFVVTGGQVGLWSVSQTPQSFSLLHSMFEMIHRLTAK